MKTRSLPTIFPIMFLSLVELQKFRNDDFKIFQRKQRVCAMVGGICT